MKLHYDDVVNHEGGWWYILLDAILFVPVAMAFMFWPLPVAAAILVSGAVTFGLYRVMHRTHS